MQQKQRRLGGHSWYQVSRMAQSWLEGCFSHGAHSLGTWEDGAALTPGPGWSL